MTLPESNHPVWAAIRIIAICFTLWLNASHFDSTEFKAILGYLILGEGPGWASTFKKS